MGGRWFFSALLIFLGGCTLFPLSEADCKPASWRAKGYDDGYFGNYAQDARYQEECARRYGVQIATAEYMAGWKDGYDEYDRLRGSMKKVGR